MNQPTATIAEVSDSDNLRMLADWFDLEQSNGRWPGSGTEVQGDLRRIADEIERLRGGISCMKNHLRILADRYVTKDAAPGDLSDVVGFRQIGERLRNAADGIEKLEAPA